MLEKKLGGKASFAQTESLFSLLQVHGSKMPQKTRRVVMSFLQQQDPREDIRKALLQEAEEVAPPEAAVYESSSGKILDMIEELGNKFEDEKMECEKRETNAKNAFMMVEKDLTSSVMEAEMQIGTKKS